MITKTNLSDGSSRELRKIVSKEYDSSKSPVTVTVTLDCGCSLVRPASRLPKGPYMYCHDCRARKRAAESN